METFYKQSLNPKLGNTKKPKQTSKKKKKCQEPKPNRLFSCSVLQNHMHLTASLSRDWLLQR